MPLFRRPKEQMLSLVASAREVKIGDPREIQRRYEERQPWQQEAWDYFDLIGEAKYAILWQGNSMSKLKLFAAWQESADAEPEPIEQDDPNPTHRLALEAMDRLRSPLGDHSEILRMAAINLSVAGECYMVGLAPTAQEEESWFIKSVDEIRNEGGTFSIVEGRQRLRVITPDDFILRIWLSHPRYSNLADSNMRGVLNTCRSIIILELADRSEARNRAALAGILKVPQELTFGPTDPTSDNEEDDPFVAELIETLTAPLQDEGSAAAMMPLIVRGSAEYLSELQHIPLDRPMDRWFDQRLERSLRRLAQGLNVPPEIVLGLTDVNHWNAWMIQEEAFRAHIEPQALQIVEALSVGYLRRRLEAAGIPPDEADHYVVWYDPSKLVTRPDRTGDAMQGHDRLVLSNEGLAEILGFGLEAMPSKEEMLIRGLFKFGPEIVTPLAALLGIEAPPMPAPAAPPGTPGPGMPNGAPPSAPIHGPEGNGAGGVAPVPGTTSPPGQPGPPNNGDAPDLRTALTAAARKGKQKNLGQQLFALDNDLRARVAALFESDMRRALKRAGARMRQKVKRDKVLTASISRVKQEEVVATIGKAGLVAAGIEIEELLDDAFDETVARYERWTQRAQDAALKAVWDRYSLRRNRMDDTRVMLADARKWGADWVKQQMSLIAQDRLYDPDLGDYTAAELGEIDDTAVTPFSLTRVALALAGGAALAVGADLLRALKAEELAEGAAWGPVVQEVLREEGIAAAAFVWNWGSYPRNPFQPHLDLDGEEFSSFSDDVLRNSEPWPNTEYFYPGDHEWCRCGVEPFISE